MKAPRFPRTVYGLAGGLFATCVALAQARADDRALIIGINTYANLGEDSQLTASVNDARLMERLAEEQWGFKPEQVLLLIDEQATADAIRKSLASWLVDGTRAGDRAFFYYSGHGYFVPDTDGDEADGKDETLVASDVRKTPNGFINMVTDDEVGEELDKLKGRSVMVIADSCHSGTITRALDPASHQGPSIEKSPKWTTANRGGSDLADKPDQIALTREAFAERRRSSTFFRHADRYAKDQLDWTAVAATEVAQEDVTREPEQRNGVFTRSFVQGIKDRAADSDGNGTVSAAELLLFVRTKAMEYCASNRCLTGMTPTFEPGGADLARDMLVWPRPTSDIAQLGEPSAPVPVSAPPTSVLSYEHGSIGSKA